MSILIYNGLQFSARKAGSRLPLTRSRGTKVRRRIAWELEFPFMEHSS